MRWHLVLGVVALSGCGYDFETYLPDDNTLTDQDTGSADGATAVDTGTIVLADTGTADDTTVATDTEPTPDTTVAPDTTPPPDTTVADTTPPPDTAMPDTRMDATDAAVACTDAEGKVYNGHCYFPVGATNWNNAQTNCLGRGAHLVTITSAGEETFVETIRPGNDRWIGLRRTGASAFTWITGETLGFTKWATGEPNGSGECARLRNANDWGDQNCTNNEVAICERE